MLIDKSFGGRLKQVFEKSHGFTQNKEIAEALNVTEGGMSNYINGRVPPPETLLKISRLTGCSIHWLVTGEGQMYAPDKDKKHDYRSEAARLKQLNKELINTVRDFQQRQAQESKKLIKDIETLNDCV